jgi:hypothetical protein
VTNSKIQFSSSHHSVDYIPFTIKCHRQKEAVLNRTKDIGARTLLINLEELNHQPMASQKETMTDWIN